MADQVALAKLPAGVERLIEQLWQEIELRRPQLLLTDAYYRGEEIIRDLGISIPPQMRGLRLPVGWPAVAIEAVEERLEIDGWSYGVSGGEDDLADIWATNLMRSESGLAHTDALVYGSSFAVAGSAEDGGQPIITVESPLDFGVRWDARTRTIVAGLRRWQLDGNQAVTVYLPDATWVCIRTGRVAGWQVVSVDEHNLGEPPIVRLANRERASDRAGKSDITPEIMALTDAASRTLVGAEVAREFFAAPQRYLMGASSGAFQNADGTSRSAWETYIGRILAVEADDQGNLPTVGQFPSGDPAVFDKLMSMFAREFAARVGLPPNYLGFVNANPPSADAIRAGEIRLVKKAERKISSFSPPWGRLMRLALLIRDGAGSLPPEAARITPLWRDCATPTIAAQTDATVKLVSAGILPATSDVTLRRAGLTAAEIQQVKIDRSQDAGEQILAQLASAASAKMARADVAVAQDLGTPAS